MTDNCFAMKDDSVDHANLTVKNIERFICDSNGNDQDQFSLDIDFLHSGESLRDPDSMSMISDYSEMGLQIKQSIKFSDMIMSTYADLKVICVFAVEGFVGYL